jgi:hypothetical protein
MAAQVSIASVARTLTVRPCRPGTAAKASRSVGIEQRVCAWLLAGMNVSCLGALERAIIGEGHVKEVATVRRCCPRA